MLNKNEPCDLIAGFSVLKIISLTGIPIKLRAMGFPNNNLNN